MGEVRAEDLPVIGLQVSDSGHVARASGQWRGHQWSIYGEWDGRGGADTTINFKSADGPADGRADTIRIRVYPPPGSPFDCDWGEVQDVSAALIWSRLRALEVRRG